MSTVRAAITLPPIPSEIALPGVRRNIIELLQTALPAHTPNRSCACWPCKAKAVLLAAHAAGVKAVHDVEAQWGVTMKLKADWATDPSVQKARDRILLAA